MSVMENWWVTPKRRVKDIPKEITLGEKIDIFSERINGWKIEVADQLINGQVVETENGRIIIGGNPNSAYATLDIILSYFEMIAKYHDGYTDARNSEAYFKKGFCMVFPETRDIDEKLKPLLAEVLDILYHGARCGMYHVGLTDTRIFLAGGDSPPIKFFSNRKVLINPHLLVRMVRYHFNEYVEELKNPNNSELRENFEKRFDKDTS